MSQDYKRDSGGSISGVGGEMPKHVWLQESFCGGCRYYSDIGTIEGHYSLKGPLKFEAYRENWISDDGEVFERLEDAIRYMEDFP